MDPHSIYGMIIPMPAYSGSADLDVRLIQDDYFIGSSKIELRADSADRMVEYLILLKKHVDQALLQAQKAAAS